MKKDSPLADTPVVTRDWVDLKVQLSLKDYATRADLKEVRDKCEANTAALQNKLDKPSIWNLVIPLIVALVVWAGSIGFSAVFK